MNLYQRLVVCIGAALVLNGCVAGQPEKVQLSVTWAVQKADGTQDACPSSYNKVMIVAQGSSGSPYSTLLNCSSTGSGTLMLLPGGDDDDRGDCDAYGLCTRSPAYDLTGIYDVNLVMTEESGQVVYSHTFDQTVDLSGGPQSLAFKLTPNASYRRINWGFQAKSTGDLINCAGAAVDTIKVSSKLERNPDYEEVADGRVTVDTFPCENETNRVDSFANVGAGTTSALDFGYYSARVEAFTKGALVGTEERSGLKEVTRELIGFTEGGFVTVETR